MEELKAKKTDFWKPHFDTIVSNEEFNIRTDYGDIEGLANSIQTSGLKKPLSGHRDKETNLWYVTDGHRRYRAIKLLRERGVDYDYVPFVLEPKGYSVEDRAFDLFLMNDGKPLTPLEQCELFKRFMLYGYTIKEIARKIERNQGYVRSMLEVANLPKVIKNEVAENKISATTAVKLIKQGKSTNEVLEEVNSTEKKVTMSSVEKYSYLFYIKYKDSKDEYVSFNRLIKLLLTLDSIDNIKDIHLVQKCKETKAITEMFSFNKKIPEDLSMEYDGKNTLTFKSQNKIKLALKLIKGIKSVVNMKDELK